MAEGADAILIIGQRIDFDTISLAFFTWDTTDLDLDNVFLLHPDNDPIELDDGQCSNIHSLDEEITRLFLINWGSYGLGNEPYVGVELDSSMFNSDPFADPKITVLSENQEAIAARIAEVTALLQKLDLPCNDVGIYVTTSVDT
ncbi:hypothetical protein HQ571_00280 [Candidatus Kuenenbacteria bacterium]|nr:hypothetical protein [Candidatus Kuenenbacteria bacterium]